MKRIERRTFLKAAATASAFTILKPGTAFGTSANSAVRMGFIGCGNRGTAVLTTMSEFNNIDIIALADLFEDKLDTARKKFSTVNSKKGFPAIQDANIYRGSNAYMRLLGNKDVDAVLISTPAYAHPEILEAAVNAGKHAYCEKPAAIDTEGCNRILRLGEKINNKLSVVLGFQIRYAPPYSEMVKRIQRGDIGELISVQLYYLSSGSSLKSFTGFPYDEARIRNHFHFTELSGGILLDQGIHILDVCNWALQSLPLHAIGDGGKKCTAEFGNTWTNYQAIYKYPDDINVSIISTQSGPAFGDVCARFMGTKGIAEAHYSGGVFISGENAWDSGVLKSASALTPEKIASGASLSSLKDADMNKGKSFIESIQSGNYLNLLRPGCASTLTAILGRKAATSHETVTWDDVVLSSERIDPGIDLKQFDK